MAGQVQPRFGITSKYNLKDHGCNKDDLKTVAEKLEYWAMAMFARMEEPPGYNETMDDQIIKIKDYLKRDKK